MAQDQQLNQLLTVENSFPKLPEFFISFAKNKLRCVNYDYAFLFTMLHYLAQ